MNAAERQEIRARADKATPGPWRAIGTDVSAQIPGWESRWYVAKCKIPEPVLGGIETFPSMANADFIAAARTDIPRLLDALDAAEAAITAAVAAERERAAKVCEAMIDWNGNPWWYAAMSNAAEEIRKGTE